MNPLRLCIGLNGILPLTFIGLMGFSITGLSESPDIRLAETTDTRRRQIAPLTSVPSIDSVAYNAQFQLKKKENADPVPKADNVDAEALSGPDRTQFGAEWPALKECLQFSDEGGDWIGGGVTYHFEPDGVFRASYTTSYFNRLYRQRNRAIEFTGRWKLALRDITTADQKNLNIVTKNNTKGHFLVITLTEVTVEPPFGEKEERSKIFPSPKGGRFSKEAKLFLDEVNEYQIPGTRYIGKSDPRFLHWLVLEDELGFFPSDTTIGEKAWTLVHKVDLQADSVNETNKTDRRAN